MNDWNWELIREFIYLIGALAGIFTVVKLVYEQRFKRDQERISYVIGLLDEIDYQNMEYSIWYQRCVPSRFFEQLDRLGEDLRQNSDHVRFGGPLAKHLKKLCLRLSAAYSSLRELIQVNEWEPRDRQGEMYWVFNKTAFNGPEGYPKNYDTHLKECADRAKEVYKAYQRIQIVAETHFFESPFVKWLLPRRFKTNNLDFND